MSAVFGPAGNGEDFANSKYKKSIDCPKFLNEFGLDCFEYQCGKGVKTGRETALNFGLKAVEFGISLSVHAPYFISLSSVDEEKRLNSINYILQSAELATFLGAKRIIIHSGSCSKMSRQDALQLACDTLKKARNEAVDKGFEDIHFCPETMGKINQLGTLEEVLELCKCDESFIPCIDFGHLNARTFGGIKTKADYEQILNKVENELGIDRLRIFHSHFSKIEYTLKGGESKHLTFEDDVFGPDYEPLLELVYKKNLSPTFICESAGTQAKDALKMKKYYENVK